jgi:hypothetical protein
MLRDNSNVLYNFLKVSRHYGTVVILISQYFKETSPNIYDLTDYLILFRGINMERLK